MRKYLNNYSADLTTDINNSAITCTVSIAPPLLQIGEYYIFTLSSDSAVEIVKCTNVSGNTLTIIRAQENTSALSFATGDNVELRETAKSFSELDGVLVKRSACVVNNDAAVDINRSNGGIQRLSLSANSSLSLSMEEGERLSLYLTPNTFEVTSWPVNYWMTSEPILSGENLIMFEKVGGNVYAFDGGSRQQSINIDVTGANFVASGALLFGNPSRDFQGMDISPDGTSIISWSNANFKWLFRHIMTTAFNVTTYATETYTYKDLSAVIVDIYGLQIWDGGNKLIVSRTGSSKSVRVLNLSSPLDITTATLNSNQINLTAIAGNPRGVVASEDGLKVIVIVYDSLAANTIAYEYTLTTAFDLSTATQTNSVNLTTMLGEPAVIGITYEPLSKSFFVATQSAQASTVKQIDSSGFGLSDLTYNNKSYTISGFTPRDISVFAANSKMYVLGSDHKVHEYDL